MLVVDPEKRMSLSQIEKHRWFVDSPTIDTGPNHSDLQLNRTVVEHMLQLPGLNQNMIVHSIKNNSFDHIYAIYNLLVDKLLQRTIKFQSKISKKPENIDASDEDDYGRAPKINERSESFNEQLVNNMSRPCKSGEVVIVL